MLLHTYRVSRTGHRRRVSRTQQRKLQEHDCEQLDAEEGNGHVLSV